ncbi:MAG: polysaccharide deacetylase family protein [Candidatus Acidiferrales bacterium]
MPLRFEIAKLTGPRYSLRCLLFHDIADQVCGFTKGLGVTLGIKDFEATIKFISRYYTPIGLQDYLGARPKGKLPHRPILVTFDDAYASVALNAAPILRHYKVPAVFLVNASLIGNEELGLDNLLCYVANTSGVETVRSVARQFAPSGEFERASLEQVFDDLLPVMSQDGIRKFRTALSSAAGISSVDLARRAKLYVTAEQLRALAESGFEIGNHTFSHVFCRSLAGGDFEQEIDANKAKLETITGSRVRAFSVPYGSPADLTRELADNLRRFGHEVVFLARDRSNSPGTDLYRLNRINVHAGSEQDLFGQIEILPRLRSLADLLFCRNTGLPKALDALHDSTM